jgi:hypothetical protein
MAPLGHDQEKVFALFRCHLPGGVLSIALYWRPASDPPHVEKVQRMRPLQSLTCEALIDLPSATFRHIPDTRHPDWIDYSLHDILMSGFAMLCFQHHSLLEFQRKMQ